MNRAIPAPSLQRPRKRDRMITNERTADYRWPIAHKRTQKTRRLRLPDVIRRSLMA